jgi:hypothetical protein
VIPPHYMAAKELRNNLWAAIRTKNKPQIRDLLEEFKRRGLRVAPAQYGAATRTLAEQPQKQPEAP